MNTIYQMDISIHNRIQCCIHIHIIDITDKTEQEPKRRKTKIEIPLHYQKPVTMQAGVNIGYLNRYGISLLVFETCVATNFWYGHRAHVKFNTGRFLFGIIVKKWMSSNLITSANIGSVESITRCAPIMRRSGLYCVRPINFIWKSTDFHDMRSDFQIILSNHTTGAL